MRLLNRVMSDHSARLGSNLKYLGALLSLFAVITAGCAMIKLKEEVSESLASTVLVGQVESAIPKKGVIVVAAYSLKKSERKIAQYTVLHEAG